MDLNLILDGLINMAGVMGYFGVFFLITMEYACFPLPSEVVLTFFGFAASKGEIKLLYVIIISIIAGIIGSLICYYIGYYGGDKILKFIRRKFKKSNKSLDKLSGWFSNYGRYAVLLARIVPLTRTYVSIIAGAEKLDVKTFTMFSTIGIAVWNIILILIGYFIGDNIELINLLIEKYTIVILLLGVVFVLGYIYNKKRNLKKEI